MKIFHFFWVFLTQETSLRRVVPCYEWRVESCPSFTFIIMMSSLIFFGITGDVKSVTLEMLYSRFFFNVLDCSLLACDVRLVKSCPSPNTTFQNSVVVTSQGSEVFIRCFHSMIIDIDVGGTEKSQPWPVFVVDFTVFKKLILVSLQRWAVRIWKIANEFRFYSSRLG